MTLTDPQPDKRAVCFDCHAIVSDKKQTTSIERGYSVCTACAKKRDGDATVTLEAERAFLCDPQFTREV